MSDYFVQINPMECPFHTVQLRDQDDSIVSFKLKNHRGDDYIRHKPHVLKQAILMCVIVLCPVSAFTQDQLKTQAMTTSDFTTTISVDQTQKEAFNAINNVRGWWSEEIEGSTNKLNDEFKYHFQDLHRTELKIVELTPEKKIVWFVKDNYFKSMKDKSEWIGTKIIFEISQNDNKTQIQFTHLGLVPEYECYNVCREGWTHYINNSLRSLITTGIGLPNGKDKPRTESEKKLGSVEAKQ
jgi:hypothetical protein